jgi:hypothetical protein
MAASVAAWRTHVSLAEMHVLLTGDRPGRSVEVDPVRIAF